MAYDEALRYLESWGFHEIIEAAQAGGALGVTEKLRTREPFKPEIVDLWRLHRFVLESKRTTILEFGTGWSTWVLADALSRLQKKHQDEVKDMRRNNPFEIHVVDGEAEFIEISRNRLPDALQEMVIFHQSPAQMGLFEGKICSFYDLLPTINPDFVYVDGPHQFSVQSEVNGWSSRHPDIMPMSGDILRIEHYLTPGTVVIFDGRAANARFFASNVQRNWIYRHHEEYDQHFFTLDEAPLGYLNKRQMDFYLADPFFPDK